MRTSITKVSINIRMVVVFLCALQCVYSFAVFAQSPSQTIQETPIQRSVEQAASDQSSLTQSEVNANAQQTILRIEDTIRGNKEQPQVLTIVPWQLPVHQRINQNTEWQLQVQQLPSIERNAFLRNLSLVKEIQASQATEMPPLQTKKDQ